jgi:ribosome-associated protein
VKTRNFANEFVIKATRSSGAGGQNVNKIASRIELIFNLSESKLLTEAEKEILANKWQHRLAQDGSIRIVCQEDRSQLKNKEKAIKKFYDLVKKSLHQPKKRIPLSPSKASIEARLKEKSNQAQKKEIRKSRIDLED